MKAEQLKGLDSAGRIRGLLLSDGRTVQPPAVYGTNGERCQAWIEGFACALKFIEPDADLLAACELMLPRFDNPEVRLMLEAQGEVAELHKIQRIGRAAIANAAN